MQTDSHIELVSPDHYYACSRQTERIFCNCDALFVDLFAGADSRGRIVCIYVASSDLLRPRVRQGAFTTAEY